MSHSAESGSAASRLVIVLSAASPEAPQAAHLALRYAATAAALDVAVELHVVSAGAVALLTREQVGDALLAEVKQATEHGALIVVCPVALAEQGLRIDDLIGEVGGVRGAASLLAAGLTPGARFLSF